MHPPQNLIDQFKQIVIKSSGNPDFIHHDWFVKYHLEVVNKIAHELLQHYPKANPEIVKVLVWLHDYGKTIDFSNQYRITLEQGRKDLTKLGFAAEFIDKVIEYMEIIDKKMELDISQAPIEVQIVSSADGCSHLTGPFMYFWWYENSSKSFQELMADNIRKANKSWTRKVVLPEARQAFEARYNFVLEQAGELPRTYLG
ncbi:MAG: HD domain-containing protein [Candidatus Saccharimonadales bacterium]